MGYGTHIPIGHPEVLRRQTFNYTATVNPAPKGDYVTFSDVTLGLKLICSTETLLTFPVSQGHD